MRKHIAKCRGHVAGSADKVAGVPFYEPRSNWNQLDFILTLLFWFSRSNAGDLTLQIILSNIMDASPLTQQSRPESFKPKIVQLYENLFKVRV